MTDVQIDDFKVLVDRYADRIRRICLPDREVELAHLFVEALTDVESRHSNARRLQQVRAVNAAAERVRAERPEVRR